MANALWNWVLLGVWRHNHLLSKFPAVIACRRAHLEARCRERGYTLNEVMACVISQDGHEWKIDVEHAAYPRHPKPGFVPPQPEPALPSRGPGAELKALLAGWPFHIVATADCKCTTRAAYMDAKGCDWCASDEGMTEIMAFLRESAEERGLPFVDIAARVLVRRAIHNARRKESVADAEGSSHHDRREALAPTGDAAQG
jgi:hypothetical protein